MSGVCGAEEAKAASPQGSSAAAGGGRPGPLSRAPLPTLPPRRAVPQAPARGGERAAGSGAFHWRRAGAFHLRRRRRRRRPRAVGRAACVRPPGPSSRRRGGARPGALGRPRARRPGTSAAPHADRCPPPPPPQAALAAAPGPAEAGMLEKLEFEEEGECALLAARVPRVEERPREPERPLPAS